MPQSTVTNTADTVQEVFVPQYPQGITEIGENHAPIFRVDTLPVMEQRAGFQGEAYDSDRNLDSGIVLLTVLSFLLVAFSFRRGFKYFATLVRAPFSVKTQKNAFEDKTMNERVILLSLILNTCISCGIVLFHALDYEDIIPVWKTNVIVPVLICIGGAILLSVGQNLAYRVLGYVFSTKELTRIWVEANNACTALLGLALIPVSLLLNIHGVNYILLISIAVLLFVLSRILFISKGFRIFFNNLHSQLLFILYLCAMEIVPVILTLSGVILLNIKLQS